MQSQLNTFMDQNPLGSSSGLARRDFLKKTATVAAAVAATPLLRPTIYGQAPSANVIGANDKIAVAVIGVSEHIGKDHLTGIRDKGGDNNTVVAAACDVYSKRRAWAQKEANLKDSDLFIDYHELLEKRKDIDAVLIATHDPLHAPITIAALQAGKHVYCEKPLTRYLDDAFKVYDTVKKTGKVFQVGSQGCSAMGWHKCAELIKSGKLGQLVWAQGFYCRNSPGGEWNYPIEDECKPENVDWKKWLGPVKQSTPFSPEDFHRWRKYYRYCAGPLGDLVPHRLHPLMLASGNPEFPSRVSCIGTLSVHSDTTTKDVPQRETPEHVQLLAEFPSGYMITVTVSTVTAKSPGFVLYAHKASLEVGTSGESVKLLPERDFAEDVDPETIAGLQPEDLRVHEKNWFDCIRSGKVPNANIDLAVRVQTVIALAELSDRFKTTVMFDEKTRKAVDASGKEVGPLTYGA